MKSGRNGKTCPKDIRRGEGNEIPGYLRLVSSDEVPRGLLRERLRSKIPRHWSGRRALGFDRLDVNAIPVAFGEDARDGSVFADRNYGRCEHETLHVAPIFQRGVQDRCGPMQSRDDEI
jgi:hypothetical protein